MLVNSGASPSCYMQASSDGNSASICFNIDTILKTIQGVSEKSTQLEKVPTHLKISRWPTRAPNFLKL
jgi:hypothetical protein